jgi:hypothetical protein
MNLVPCPGCSRHIRIAERECPFCGSALSENIASKVIPGSTQRLSRAAAFVFTTTLAVTGCGDSSPTLDAGVAPLYGAPADVFTPPDARSDAAVTPDVADDKGGIVPLYGAVPAPDAGPAPDASADGSIGVRDGSLPRDVPGADVPQVDDGAVAPLYGAVPAPDAGKDGSIGIRYGAPPRDV